MELVLEENINMASPLNMGGDGNTQTMNHPSDFITLSDHEQFFPRKFQHPNMLIFIFKRSPLEKAKVYNLLWPTVD